MMRVFGLMLVVAWGCMMLVGCGGNEAPPPLTPDQERELEEQLEEASQLEGEGQMFDD